MATALGTRNPEAQKAPSCQTVQGWWQLSVFLGESPELLRFLPGPEGTVPSLFPAEQRQAHLLRPLSDGYVLIYLSVQAKSSFLNLALDVWERTHTANSQICLPSSHFLSGSANAKKRVEDGKGKVGHLFLFSEVTVKWQPAVTASHL